MTPNLALVHLESLNNIIYRLNPECFPTVREIEKEGVFFSQYYSTATSTIMVLSDLFYGTTDILEEQYNLTDVKRAVKIKDAIKNTDFKTDSLFDSLQKKGYRIKNYLLWGHYDVAHVNSLVAHDCDFLNTNDHDTLERDYTKFLEGEGPFALFLDDCSSAMDFLGDGREEQRGVDLKIQGFKEVNSTLEILVNVLKKYNKYENTVFVLYGDHGDDFWAHGLNEGYSHALPPYQHMIHTPLIVAGVQKSMPVIDSLLGTSELKSLILRLLEHPSEKLDKLCPCRDIVFSRNLFANQKLKIHSFNKSYSATDGKYLLLVSHYGLELYLNYFDINSFCNLLDFFVFSNGKIRFCRQLLLTRSSHFESFWTESQIEEMQEAFTKLYRLLQDEVKRKYEKSNRDYKEMSFYKIHYTKRDRLKNKYHVRSIVMKIRCSLSAVKRGCINTFMKR